ETRTLTTAARRVRHVSTYTVCEVGLGKDPNSGHNAQPSRPVPPLKCTPEVPLGSPLPGGPCASRASLSHCPCDPGPARGDSLLSRGSGLRPSGQGPLGAAPAPAVAGSARPPPHH